MVKDFGVIVGGFIYYIPNTCATVFFYTPNDQVSKLFLLLNGFGVRVNHSWVYHSLVCLAHYIIDSAVAFV